jgi:transposase-like protein
MNYTYEYRNQVVQKLLKPDSPGIYRISKDTGISPTTLYKWRRDAKNGTMSRRKSRSPRNWSLEEKQAALLESKSKSEKELGIWLREKGLHTDHLRLWENEIMLALKSVGESRSKELEREIKELRRELKHKEKALAEMSALLVLKKKFLALIGEEDQLEK